MPFKEIEMKSFAEVLFNAYNEEGPNPWKTWDGKDVPRWHDLNNQVRGKWEAVAREAKNWSHVC